MKAHRMLGGAWLCVHAPANPVAMLRWVLERGFGGVVPGPGPRAVDWPALARAGADLPLTFPALRASGVLDPPRERPETGLASANDGDRNTAFAAAQSAAELARRLGTRLVLLEPGIVRVPGEDGATDLGDPAAAWTRERAAAWLARRNALLDRALDATCRSLHALTRAHPDLVFCLGPSRDVLGIGDPVSLAAVFSDLRARNLGYWHDAAVAARRQELLGTAQGAWLEGLAGRLRGLTAADCQDGALYALPGAGPVDFAELASYRTRRGPPLPVVLELDPGVDPAELPGAHAFLSKFGL